MVKIIVAKDFTDKPGARYKSESKFSAEEFVYKLLEPKYFEAQKENVSLFIDLDGTYGYGTSFLEGSFGVMAYKYGKDFKNRLELKSLEEPYLVKEIFDIIDDYIELPDIQEDMRETIDEMKKLREKIYSTYDDVVPDFDDVFNPIKDLKINKIRAFILGQDVYPQKIDNIPVSNGLAFFINEKLLKIKPNYIPKSFSELFKNIDYQQDTFDKIGWKYKKEGLIFMNIGLTTIHNQPNSHINMWKPLIIRLLKNIVKIKKRVVFFNFGAIARNTVYDIIKELKKENIKMKKTENQDFISYKNEKYEIIMFNYIHPANRYATKEQRKKLYNWISDLERYVGYEF